MIESDSMVKVDLSTAFTSKLPVKQTKKDEDAILAYAQHCIQKEEKAFLNTKHHFTELARLGKELMKELYKLREICDVHRNTSYWYSIKYFFRPPLLIFISYDERLRLYNLFKPALPESESNEEPEEDFTRKSSTRESSSVFAKEIGKENFQSDLSKAQLEPTLDLKASDSLEWQQGKWYEKRFQELLQFLRKASLINIVNNSDTSLHELELIFTKKGCDYLELIIEEGEVSSTLIL